MTGRHRPPAESDIGFGFAKAPQNRMAKMAQSTPALKADTKKLRGFGRERSSARGNEATSRNKGDVFDAPPAQNRDDFGQEDGSGPNGRSTSPSSFGGRHDAGFNEYDHQTQHFGYKEDSLPLTQPSQRPLTQQPQYPLTPQPQPTSHQTSYQRQSGFTPWGGYPEDKGSEGEASPPAYNTFGRRSVIPPPIASRAPSRGPPTAAQRNMTQPHTQPPPRSPDDEADRLVRTLRQNRETVNKLKYYNVQLLTQINEVTQKCEQAERDKAKLNRHIDEMNQKVRAAEDKYHAYEKRVKIAMEKIKANRGERDGALQQLEDARAARDAELKLLVDSRTELLQSLEVAKKDCADANAALGRTRQLIAELHERATSHSANEDKLKTKLKELQNSLAAEKLKNAERVKELRSELSAQRKSSDEEIEKLNRKLIAETAARDASHPLWPLSEYLIQAFGDDPKPYRDALRTIETQDADVKDLRVRLNDALDELDECKRDLTDKTFANGALTSRITQAEDVMRTIATQASDEKKAKEALQDELGLLRTSFDKAKDEWAQKEVEFTQATTAAKAAMQTTLLHHENLQKEVASLRKEHQQEVATLRDEVQSWKDKSSAASNAQMHAEALAEMRTAAIANLQEIIAANKEALISTQKAHDALEKELAKSNMENTRLQNRLSAVQAQTQDTLDERGRSQDETIKALKNKIAELNESLLEAKSEQLLVSSEWNDAHTAYQKLQDDNAALVEQNAELQEALAAGGQVSAELEEARVAIEQVEAEKAEVLEQMNVLMKEKANLENSLEQLTKDTPADRFNKGTMTAEDNAFVNLIKGMFSEYVKIGHEKDNRIFTLEKQLEQQTALNKKNAPKEVASPKAKTKEKESQKAAPKGKEAAPKGKGKENKTSTRAPTKAQPAAPATQAPSTQAPPTQGAPPTFGASESESLDFFTFDDEPLTDEDLLAIPMTQVTAAPTAPAATASAPLPSGKKRVADDAGASRGKAAKITKKPPKAPMRGRTTKADASMDIDVPPPLGGSKRKNRY